MREDCIRGGDRTDERLALPLHRLPDAERNRLSSCCPDVERELQIGQRRAEDLHQNGGQWSKARARLLRGLRHADLRISDQQSEELFAAHRHNQAAREVAARASDLVPIRASLDDGFRWNRESRSSVTNHRLLFSKIEPVSIVRTGPLSRSIPLNPQIETRTISNSTLSP